MKTWQEQINAGGTLRLIGAAREREAIAALEFIEMVEAGTAIVPAPDDSLSWLPGATKS